MTILEAKKLGAVLFPAAGFLPKFGRLHQRHQQLNCTRAVHFLADDLLNLADRAQADRHIGVNAGGKLLDHAGTDHVLLADHISIGRRFFQRGKEIGTGAHFFLTCVCENNGGFHQTSGSRWYMGNSFILTARPSER